MIDKYIYIYLNIKTFFYLFLCSFHHINLFFTFSKLKKNLFFGSGLYGYLYRTLPYSYIFIYAKYYKTKSLENIRVPDFTGVYSLLYRIKNMCVPAFPNEFRALRPPDWTYWYCYICCIFTKR